MGYPRRMDFNFSGEGRAKLDVITIEGKESSCEFRRPCKRGMHMYIGDYVSHAGVYGNIIRCRHILYS